jgi:hypothetical protein
MCFTGGQDVSWSVFFFEEKTLKMVEFKPLLFILRSAV